MIRRKARLTVLVPLVVFATVSGLFAVLWSVVEARDASEAGRRADLTTEQIATRLLEHVSFRVNLLEKIRYDWRRGHIESAKTFGEHAESALYGTVALSSITWIDESGIMRWTAPEMRNSTAIGQSVFAHVIAGPILREALETGQWRLTPMLDLTTRRPLMSKSASKSSPNTLQKPVWRPLQDSVIPPRENSKIRSERILNLT